MSPTVENVSAEQVAQHSSLIIGELSKELVQAYDNLLYESARDVRLLRGITARLDEIARLESEVRGLKRRLAALEKSRAMRIQRKYWSFRSLALKKLGKP